MNDLALVFLKIQKRLALACVVEVKKNTGTLPFTSYIEYPSRKPEDYSVAAMPTLILTGFEYQEFLSLERRTAVVSLARFTEIESFKGLWQAMQDVLLVLYNPSLGG
ncbi:MAG: hypothetical protein NZL90_01255 [Aquificaceae bacterium]|nr:hypothetical protein [Aquificaceae bacterium]MDW8237062.1 hypothetical protein [Aquificaceae bacterium]